MAKYKVSFSGFAYVNAESQESALEAYFDGLSVYEESGVDAVEEVDEFEVRI